jgi:4-amino-4-deoxy-L-arabinose transferase-like glycosyltransferase
MQGRANWRHHRAAFIAAALLTIFGLSARLYLLSASGNLSVGPLSGTGDQIRYQTLADNISHGEGFTYAGQPTALRAPVYPLLLAASKIMFGSHYLLSVRVLQFSAGILLSYLCLMLGTRLFGAEAGALAGALALTLPTLVLTAGELQTESLASLLTALFFVSLFASLADQQKTGIAVGAYSGLSALLRFNAALLVVLGALALVWRDRGFRRALTACGVAGLLVAPWLIRNVIVFHGRVLYSTHGGINLLEGVLVPQGRGQPEEGNRVQAVVGWAHADVETNAPSRLRLPSEDVLDRQARTAAFSAWKALDWKARTRLLATKVVCFWLSTDQLLATSSFPRRQRLLRAAGVITYWIVLILAFIGWRRLLAGKRILALAVAGYCLLVTAAHLPFVMNTRLRISFVDPLLAVLGAGGIAVLFSNYGSRTPSAVTDPRDRVTR